jgi:hypothetical protein
MTGKQRGEMVVFPTRICVWDKEGILIEQVYGTAKRGTQMGNVPSERRVGLLMCWKEMVI